MAVSNNLGPLASTTANCGNGTFNLAYWTECDHIDWTTMSGNYDEDTMTVSAFDMLTGGQWHKLQFTRKNARYDFEYVEDDNFYNMQITNLVFEGHDPARTKQFCDAIESCCILLYIFDSDGQERVVGYEWQKDLDEFIDPYRRLKISRHLDTNGGFNEMTRDEMDMRAEQKCSAWYGSVGKAGMDALLTPAI